MLRPDICRYYKKRINHLPFGPCLSLGGIATLYLQAFFNDNHVIIEVTFLLLLITLGLFTMSIKQMPGRVLISLLLALQDY